MMDTCITDTFIMDTSIMDTCILDTYIMDTCIIHYEYMHHSCTDTCIIDIEVDKEVLVLVTFAGVARPERPKGVKDEVKRPEGPSTRSRGLEGS